MTETSTIAYGDDFKVALANLPAESILYLCQRGLAHYLGNQVASRVTAAKAKRAADNKESPDFNDAELATLTHDLRTEAWDKLLSGDVGGPGGGPRGDALTREVNRLAEIAAKAWARAKGVAWAKVSNQKDIIAKFAAKADIIEQAKANVEAAKDLGGADDEIDIDIETA